MASNAVFHAQQQTNAASTNAWLASRTDTLSNSVVAINANIGNIESTGTNVALHATNFVYSAWRWTDMLTSMFIVTDGNTEPVKVDTGDGILALGYDRGNNGADASFSLQSPHKFAATNAANPSIYIIPHSHSALLSAATGTNATWVLQLKIAPVGGIYSDYYNITNTHTYTLTNGNEIVSFGRITNNLLSGRSSVKFRGRTFRIDSGAGDVGSGAVVTLDSFDIHIPIDQIGSAAENGD